MTGSAVHFGAGAIGRGFLGQLYCESGLDVTFVDVSASMIAALQREGRYRIQIVGPGAKVVEVTRVRGLHVSEVDEIARAVAGAVIVSTAAGARALPALGPLVAAGLSQRFLASREPLNVVVCENLHDAPHILRRHVEDALEPAAREWAAANVGFLGAVVSRMVPARAPQDLDLDIRAEAYGRLPVEARAVKGELPAICGMEPVANFHAHSDRKLYTHNCSHAVLGFAGHAAGYRYGHEAVRDPRILGLVRAVMDETGSALVLRHAFAVLEQRAYEEDLVDRFGNYELGDTCERLARDPIRKLAEKDRLVGAARMCLQESVSPHAVSWGIAAGYRYRNTDDVESVRLAGMIADQGIHSALRCVSNIDTGEPLARMVLTAYDLMGRHMAWR